MSKENDQMPVVTYEPVRDKEREAQDGLDRAFDLLFDEVLKSNWAKYRKGRGTKLPSDV